MVFREHRGGLAESMETQIELHDRHELICHLKDLLSIWADITVRDEDVKVRPYRPDHRIGWETNCIVTLEGYGVVGWTDTLV